MELGFEVEKGKYNFSVYFFFFFDKLMDLFSKISNIYLLFNIFLNGWGGGGGGHSPPLSERGSVLQWGIILSYEE